MIIDAKSEDHITFARHEEETFDAMSRYAALGMAVLRSARRMDVGRTQKGTVMVAVTIDCFDDCLHVAVNPEPNW